MPTAKKRINLTLENDLYRSLERLSKREKKSLSSVSLRLIETAIALEEDRYFSNEADKRLARKEKRLSHADAWKE
jgi:predicted DNA-binding protein